MEALAETHPPDAFERPLLVARRERDCDAGAGREREVSEQESAVERDVRNRRVHAHLADVQAGRKVDRNPFAASSVRGLHKGFIGAPAAGLSGVRALRALAREGSKISYLSAATLAP